MSPAYRRGFGRELCRAARYRCRPAALNLFYLQGYHTAGDGGAGFFVWNSAATTTADGGVVVNPTWNSGAGRFFRQLPNDRVVFPDYWGAYGDNTHDDSTAILAAIAFTVTGAYLIFPADISTVKLRSGHGYICNQALHIDPGYTVVDLNGGMLNFSGSGGNLDCITIALNLTDGIQALEQVVLRNGFLEGSQGGLPTTTTETMVAMNASVLTIENVYVFQTGRAFDIRAQSFLVTIRECGAQNFYSGVSSVGHPLNSGENCKVIDCTFSADCNYPIDWQNPGAQKLTVARTSFDYGPSFIRNQGGRIDAIDCHFETDVATGSGQFYIQNTGVRIPSPP